MLSTSRMTGIVTFMFALEASATKSLQPYERQAQLRMRAEPMALGRSAVWQRETAALKMPISEINHSPVGSPRTSLAKLRLEGPVLNHPPTIIDFGKTAERLANLSEAGYRIEIKATNWVAEVLKPNHRRRSERLDLELLASDRLRDQRGERPDTKRHEPPTPQQLDEKRREGVRQVIASLRSALEGQAIAGAYPVRIEAAQLELDPARPGHPGPDKSTADVSQLMHALSEFSKANFSVTVRQKRGFVFFEIEEGS